jgi:putative membrane protein
MELLSWFLRLAKGFVIGTGFIIPGVSGGVFAAIFGIYEPMIRFFGNITKDFWKNARFFLPVGMGGLISIIFVSRVLGDFFMVAQVPLVWFFIGCVLGTLPLLYKKAGEKGRKKRHFIVLAVSCLMMLAFLLFMQDIFAAVRLSADRYMVWLLAGVLMALGAIVPGLSPSNFLLYMGIYGVMMERVGRVDFGVLVPLLGGAVACVLLLSKLFDQLFSRAYAGMYHFMLGIIAASTMMIIPWAGKALENGGVVRYDSGLKGICLAACFLGVLLGYGMGVLEKRYKPEKIKS